MLLLRRHGWTVVLVAATLGCGSSDVAERQQEVSLRTQYELQKQQAPVKLSAKQRKIRQERLRMQFGDLADADSTAAPR